MPQVGKKSVIAVFGLLLPLILIVLAVPRMLEGVALARARQATAASLVEEKFPLQGYAAAASELRSVLPDDGDNLIRQAELVAHAANGQAAGLAQARAIAVTGLLHSPANPRGWTLLCEIDDRINRPAAPACMETGFFIAPFDWFTARRRAILAADLWPDLSDDVRQAAARRVRMMWESDRWDDHRVKFSLYDVYRTPNGPQLLGAGMRDNRDELREMNRWLIQQAMYGDKP